MSDEKLREIVRQVIRDIDAGRVALPVPRWRRIKRLLGPPVFAAAVGAAALGCDGRAVGVNGDGGGADRWIEGPDAAVELYDAEALQSDAGNETLDGGAVLMYGEPFPEFTDAAAGDAEVQEPDGGVIDLYGVPFFDEDEPDPSPGP